MGTTRSFRSRHRRRRDRRGRGLRGPLLPASLPAASSRSEQFDALVVEALEPIESRWADDLDMLDVAVDEVPDVRRADVRGLGEGVLLDGAIPLSRLVPVGVDRNGVPTRARIVLYRRPLEARAKDPADLADLINEVLVEQIATYLGVDPEVIDGP
ncbi:MAG: exonuclease [Actinophytocola sp.]|nr:exonuclease [Actinophytocola sp.]